MEAQIMAVMNELFNLLLKVSIPAAFFRLAVSGMKHLAGDPESMATALRQVAVGLFVIYTSKVIVHLIASFAQTVSTFNGGW